MGTKQVRIGIGGRISDATAGSLGGRVEDTDGGVELVVPYLDQAQITGLLVRLGDLHIPFRHVVVGASDTNTTTTTGTNTDTTGAPS